MAPKTTTWVLCLLFAPVAVGCVTTAGRVTLADHTRDPGAARGPVIAPYGPVRVLVYNVKMLPWPAGDTVADRRRIRLIARAILAEAPRYDVVCLTEVFNETLREELMELLAEAYPHQVVRCEAEADLRQDSGLCLLSRFSFRRAAGRDLCAFTAFPLAWTWTADMLAAKGVLGVPLDLGEGRDLWIFLTHLQADPDAVGEFEAVRAEQLGWIRAFMGRCLVGGEPGRTRAALLVGDLNVVADSPEYGRMKALLGDPRDAHDEVHAGEVGYTWDPGDNSLLEGVDAPGQRLDYALIFDRLLSADGSTWTELATLHVEDCAVRRYRDRDGDYSDHHAVALCATCPAAASGRAIAEVATRR